MHKLTVGILTVSDRCHRGEAVDESGPELVKLIQDGVVEGATVVKTDVVPDSANVIKEVLERWCSEDVRLILTTGGTGVSERDVTPEAAAAVFEKAVPGIPLLIFKKCSGVTPLAALSRGLAGVKGKSLIITLPGSKKACGECLLAVACVIPHAIHLIEGNQNQVETVHDTLKKSSVVAARDPTVMMTKSPYPAIPVEKAQEIVLTKSNLLKKSICVSLEEAFGHVLSEDLIARKNRPAVDLSLKDGYAIRSTNSTSRLSVVRTLYPGDDASQVVIPPNSCVRISTGGQVPQNADRVVEVENTTVVRSAKDSQPAEVEIITITTPQKDSNILKKGSDYEEGTVLLNAGVVIRAAEMGILAATDSDSVRVFRRPKVAVMSTGNELVDVHEECEGGKIRDINRTLLKSLLKEAEFEVVDLGIARDEPDLLRQALETGFRTADVVVTSGSMSMGDRDYLKEIIRADFGGEIFFGRVHMKPGKPTSFGAVKFGNKTKLWFGLPGNPASTFVTSHLFLLPALRKCSGWKNPLPTSIKNTVPRNLADWEDRPHYVRGVVSYDEEQKTFVASMAKYQSSSWIGSCAGANALILHPERPRNTEPAPKALTAFLLNKSSLWA